MANVTTAAIARIAALAVYPVKSCRGIALAAARVATTGLEHDREWMVVDARGRFLTQRTHPALATVATTLDDRALTLTAPGREPLRVPFDQTCTWRRVVVWSAECDALDHGEQAADWLSSLLGESARLVRATPGMRRADPAFTQPAEAPLAFPDGYPILVASTASLAWLNERLPEPVPMERFRANVVLDGLAAFDEDHLDRFTAGAVRLKLVKPCTRCVVPSIDQVTGVRGADPVEVLRATRYDRALKGITFGENAIVLAGVGASLAVGSTVALSADAAAAND